MNSISQVTALILIVQLLLGCAVQSPRKKSHNLAARRPPPPVKQKQIERPSFYVVQVGESLTAIARRFGVNVQSLAEWNGLKPPFTVHAGQTLFLFKPDAGLLPESTRPTPPLVEEKISEPILKKSTNSIANENKLKLYWQWPLKGDILKTYSVEECKGIEIAGNFGEMVNAAASGRVVYSGDGLQGYGNLIIVKHDDRFLTAYANNSKRLVSEGDAVEQGQPIAEVGLAGGRTYLHFEIRKNGNPVDPVSYLPDKK